MISAYDSILRQEKLGKFLDKFSSEIILLRIWRIPSVTDRPIHFDTKNTSDNFFQNLVLQIIYYILNMLKYFGFFDNQHFLWQRAEKESLDVLGYTKIG